MKGGKGENSGFAADESGENARGSSYVKQKKTKTETKEEVHARLAARIPPYTTNPELSACLYEFAGLLARKKRAVDDVSFAALLERLTGLGENVETRREIVMRSLRNGYTDFYRLPEEFKREEAVTVRKKNAFSNHGTARTYDYEEIERLSMERLDRELEGEQKNGL